ncbi:non-homologous end-joining DNA ligase [Evansella halocellulosilytica]|uniref:non-homologous end-joining DNA ligase n=1 Tax=Evansella halocellulosilytica TaxID=2011013 RepID=UPI000BB6F14C|nr:non-homologous end-joining DNA ligase [Evansella halocellulosilytica]
MSLQPIIPFEPIKKEIIPNGDEWVAQIKWDGVRILTYYDGKSIELYNRKLNERTKQFPEITEKSIYKHAQSIILDGEVIAFKDGRPSFSEVMRRDGLRSENSIHMKRHQIPIAYMIFDILYLNGEWLTQLPLKRRQEMMNDVITANSTIQLVKNYDDGSQLFEAIKEQKMEGIICKDLTSTYTIKAKDDRWVKIKNFQDIYAVVGGVTYRGDTVNSLLLGMFDNNNHFHYVGHAGTGKLSAADWNKLTKLIEPLKVTKRPFKEKPERAKHAVWIRPELVVKIQYIEWPAGRSIRQPSIQAFIDTSAEECILPAEHQLL